MFPRKCCLGALTALLATVSAAAQVAIIGSPGHLVKIHFYPKRQHPDDLEVGGDLYGVKPGKTHFITYDDLLKLPQVNATVTSDENFVSPVTVSGVDLEQLPSMLGANFGQHMVTAICDDQYAAHYPAAYLRAHHPILVLRIDGRDHAHWPLSPGHLAMGPYMISHDDFRPAFRVLAHDDEPQIPWGVIRLDFRREADVYRPILPLGPDAQSTPVQQGYTIARENCFRCHAREGEGGAKSSFGWDTLARMAVRRPDWFAQYVRDPKSINPQTHMAASPKYDDATLAALRAYFTPFADAH